MEESNVKLNFLKTTILENADLEVFTNSFIYHDDTYFQESVGSLFGVIQVLDDSEQSEYIPNLLTNLIKKEFYSQSKRPTEESFEAGLKKANLALADLAEHDILKWNNNLHSLVGVFKNRTLYFTQVGLAKIFLGRDNKIINLSEPNLSTNIHPVKTFRDVVVGEIKPNDKIIITTPTIQNIFKPNDLNRLFDTFDSKEFDNLFIKTIKKEGKNISAIIINIEEREKKIIEPKSTIALDENMTIEKLTKNKNFLGGKIKKIEKKQKNKKVKKDTGGGISLKEKRKGEDPPKSKSATRTENPPLAKIAKAKFPQKKKERKKNSQKEKIKTVEKKSPSGEQKNKNLLLDSSKKELGAKTFSKNNKPIKKLNDLKPVEKVNNTIETSPFEKTPEIYISSDDDNLEKASKKLPSKKLKKYFSSNKTKKEKNTAKKFLPDKTTFQTLSSADNKSIEKLPRLISKGRNSFNTIRNILKHFFQQAIHYLKRLNLPDNLSFLKENKLFRKESLTKFNLAYFLILIKKYYLFVLLGLFMILTPLIVFWLHSSKKNTPSPQSVSVKRTNNLNGAPLIENKDSTRIIASLNGELNLISENATVILVYGNSNKLYEINKEKKGEREIIIPKNINLDKLKSIVYMPSLNLFFLSSDSKIISYSPTTKKFYSNKINLPNNFNLLDQGTYLDYLYLLDKNSKQIYRYPRDTGGFGSKKDWLKTPLANSDTISALAVDDNIRLAYSDGTVEKYFKNKLIGTKKFETKNLKDIYTKDGLKNYYLLDKDAGKIIQVDKKNDQITNEYQNKALTKTNNFSVDEKNRKIYLLNAKNILSINLNF